MAEHVLGGDRELVNQAEGSGRPGEGDWQIGHLDSRKFQLKVCLFS